MTLFDLMPTLFAMEEDNYIFKYSGFVIAGFKFGIGVWGVYCTIWIWQLLRRRAFGKRQAESEFVEQICGLIDESRFEEAEALTAAPQHWFRAIPMLARTAIRHRWMSGGKLQQLVKIHLDNEVMSGIENSLMHINTGIKAAPMFGLLGTVIGMISAFGKIAQMASPDASKLSDSIAFALWATAGGLFVAVILMLLGTWVMGKRKHVEEAAIGGIQQILIHLEAVRSRAAQH